MPDEPRARVYFCVERIHAVADINNDIRAIFDTRAEAEALSAFCNRHIGHAGGIAICHCVEHANLCRFRVVEKDRFDMPIYAYKGMYYHESVSNTVHRFEVLGFGDAEERGYILSDDGRWWLDPIPVVSNLERVFKHDPTANIDWFDIGSQEIISILD